ncbi:antibiotic biosynthesis monooxygenase [Arcobacter sp. CECT 9188]|uniref:antibiotic biosynthesis monooxygenase family protein n=1 Tax=Arcobacter sp. CECT 9188 TaxID=2044505 RepID=UPI000DE900EA|nr:antibiotic biosynthesis monooxygenase [Arcobacter sp. CECT 9188]RBQ27043.1 antibiotic biosynthesis monooxygenase [Arcobacter sp. CECT 9188]
MLAVIFEVEIEEVCKDEYLKIASMLKEKLINQKGFISVERFQSLVNEKRLLSLSYWEDEESIFAWKQNIDHICAQKKGRETIFKDYKINVAEVKKSYTLKTSSFDK